MPSGPLPEPVHVVASPRPFSVRRRGFIGWLPSDSARVKVYAGLDHRSLCFQAAR